MKSLPEISRDNDAVVAHRLGVTAAVGHAVNRENLCFFDLVNQAGEAFDPSRFPSLSPDSFAVAWLDGYVHAYIAGGHAVSVAAREAREGTVRSG